MRFNKIFALALSVLLFIGINSCSVQFRNTGNKKGKSGWHKHRNNPHNANTTNPGRGHEQRGTPGKSKRGKPGKKK